MTNLQKILLGKAIFTLVSDKTGSRFTYKILKGRKEGIWFVSVMTGSDNESSYSYIGWISTQANLYIYNHSIKSSLHFDSLSVQGFMYWFQRCLCESKFIQFHNAGFCFKCGRLLTTPESILSGVGPVCGIVKEGS